MFEVTGRSLWEAIKHLRKAKKKRREVSVPEEGQRVKKSSEPETMHQLDLTQEQAKLAVGSGRQDRASLQVLCGG